MAAEDNDIPEFTALDWLFHLSLFQAAGVGTLWHLIAGRSGHIDRLRRLNLPDPGKVMNVLKLHEQILTAIADGDLASAQEFVRIHLSGTLSSIPSIVQQHPEYFDPGAADLTE